jgi:hypothetical protein
VAEYVTAPLPDPPVVARVTDVSALFVLVVLEITRVS